jgi:hypothetical protein
MIASFFAGFLICLIASTLYVWHLRTRKSERPKIPKEWPLVPRALLNSKERKIWIWLSKAMYDQQIMVKIPVTRFTIPAKREEADRLYPLLNRVYFTFTVCNQQGQVLGCVDVPKNAALSMSNQTLKFGLLNQCGIPYWVVEPDNLPHINQIRTAFLGDSAALHASREGMNSRFKDVAGNLHAEVSRQRSRKSGQRSAHRASTLTDGWEQNSFVAALDSRSAELHAHFSDHGRRY